jgi:uncharacterized protein YndB with AHSA1/START domain
MTGEDPDRRTDRASRLIRAPAAAVYRALVDPDALAVWLPPEGMAARLHAFEAREGGGYRMELTYSDQAVPGKSSEHSDIVDVRFLALVPGRRIVQAVTFETDDPAFAGEMRMTWDLAPAAQGTEVTIICENVPGGIGEPDHAAGLKSSLDNLAACLERR